MVAQGADQYTARLGREVLRPQLARLHEAGAKGFAQNPR
jgi:hypothetical protein